jgi:hypothetical protein
MKKARITLLGFAIATVALLSFQNSKPTSIKGKITPAFYGVNAWAISETDTLYTSISDGSFEFPNAEPGIYKLIIEARSPYRNMAKEGIIVNEGQSTDIGELTLQKWETVYATSSN